MLSRIKKVAVLVCGILLLSSCHSVTYSDLGINIRKVVEKDVDGDVTVSYQKYDPETGCYYEAEKRDDGKWYFTEEGSELQERQCVHNLTQGS